MGITGPQFIIQDKRSDLPAFFKHAVEEASTESKKKRSVSDLSHIQDFMRAVNHDPINWGDPTRDHMTQDVLGPFATYMGKYERNKKKIKFDDDNL